MTVSFIQKKSLQSNKGYGIIRKLSILYLNNNIFINKDILKAVFGGE
jgi:hypothetical protein